MPGHLIRRLNQISVAVFTDHMTAAGLTLTPVQFGAMMTIRDHPGVDQAAVAGLIAYDRATLGKVIDRLEARDWVRRTPSQTDRRAKTLTLTKTGHQICQQALPLAQAAQPAILSGLSPAEQKQLLTLLDKATLAGNELNRAPLNLNPTRRTKTSQG